MHAGINQSKLNVYWKYLKPHEIEDFEERAAIMEFDANLSRTIAETRAYKCIISLRDENIYAYHDSKNR